MRLLSTLILLIVVRLPAGAQLYEYDWVLDLQSTDVTVNTNIIQCDADAQGNIYVCGGFVDSLAVADTVLYVAGAYANGFILKLDSSGNLIWIKQFENTDTEGVSFNGVKINSEGDLIVTVILWGSGKFNDTYFNKEDGDGINGLLLKLNSNGEIIWSQQFYGHAPYPDLMTLDNEDNIIVYGNLEDSSYFSGNILYPAVDSFYMGSFYLVKYDTYGNYLWGKTFNTRFYGGSAFVRFIETDNENNIYLSGSLAGYIKYQDVFYEWYDSYYTFYIIKLSPDSNLLFLKTADSGSNASLGMGIGVTDDVIFLSAGYDDTVFVDENELPSETFVTLIKLNKTGDFDSILYVHPNCPSFSPNSYEIIPNHHNELLISTGFADCFDLGDTILYSNDSFPKSSLLMKLNENGDRIWYDQIPLSSVGGIVQAIYRNDIVFLTGIYNENIQLGDFLLSRPYSPSFYAGFIAKIKDYTFTTYDNSVPDESVFIYPNPGSGLFSISTAINEDASLIIYNQLGEICYTENISTLVNGVYKVDISNQPDGLYFVKLVSGNTFYSGKIVKQ